MTSRVSLVKKYHLTSILILSIAFIIHFISVFMSVDNILDRASFPFEEHTIRQLANVYSPQILNGLFALAAGAYMAFDYFRYLHSKKQTDFYESLPMTRSSRFFTHFICGFSTYAVLLIITLALELVVGNVLGVELSLIFPKTIWNFISMLGIYLISWVTAALAMIMTGNSLIAVLGYGTFCIYVPLLLYNLIPTFSSIYFDTYVDLPVFAKFNLWSLFNYLSPASLMYKVSYFYSDFWEIIDHKFAMIGMIVFTLVVGYLAYVLFKKRPSEAAGRSMAFEKANSVIRILIVIPLALYLGIFLKSVSSSDSDLWLAIGILLAGFICHGLIQGIFESDVKAFLSKKKQLLLVYIICFGFLSIFKFDLFHYDEFVPKMDKVEKINIEYDDFADYLNMEFSDGIQGEYIGLALNVANEIIHTEKGTNNTSIIFEYQLKNGLIVSRYYKFPMDAVPKSLDELSTKKEFKDDYCMFFKRDLDEFTSVSYTYDHDTYIPITGADLEELVQVYMQEFTNLTFTDLYKEPVLYRFYAFYDDMDENVIDVTYSSSIYSSEWQTSCAFNVYESFDRTIEILNRLGYKTFAENEDMEMVSLEVYSNSEKYDGEIITDKILLAELKKHAYLSEFNRYWNDDELVYGWATVKSGLDEHHMDLYFEKEVFESIMK